MAQAVIPAADNRVRDTRALLERAQKQIIQALPAHLRDNDPKAERFRRIVLSLVRMEGMEKVTPDSFVSGAIRAAEIGLEPDPLFGQLYLIPYGSELQPVIGYKGMIELARRSGLITSVRANIVWPDDDFEYETGLELKLWHRPNLDVPHGLKDFDDQHKLPVCVYAVAVPKDSDDRIVAVLPPWQVMHRKSRSRSAGSNKSPWRTDPAAMWLKTAIRALSSTMPQCQQLQRALSIENDDKDTPEPHIEVPWYEVEDTRQTPAPADAQQDSGQDDNGRETQQEQQHEQHEPLTPASFTPRELQQLQRDLWTNRKVRPADLPKWIGLFKGTKEQALAAAAEVINGGAQ
jgi:recombination protein RecT